MARPTNRVTSIFPEPNEQGDNVIGITLDDGSTFDVTIDRDAAQTLVVILQRRLILLAHASARNLRFPEYEIIDANVLHQGPAAQLTLTSHRKDRSEKEYSERELPAALAFWRQYHTPDSRNRLRSAIRYFRKYRSSYRHQAKAAHDGRRSPSLATPRRA